MACNAEQRQMPGESVDQAQEDLDNDYGVNESAEEFAAENCVFFDEF